MEIAHRAADVLFTAFAAVPFGLAGPIDLAPFAAVTGSFFKSSFFEEFTDHEFMIYFFRLTVNKKFLTGNKGSA